MSCEVVDKYTSYCVASLACIFVFVDHKSYKYYETFMQKEKLNIKVHVIVIVHQIKNNTNEMDKK
jgi:hypothetical protein